MKCKAAKAVLALVFLLGATVTVSAQQETTKVGKKGEMVFSTDTSVGDVLLKAGHYRFQHRVEGTNHYVHFTELKMPRDQHMQTSMVSGERHPGEIQCRLEPLDRKVTRTAVYSELKDGKKTITRIEVSGENVAHVF